MSLRRTKPIGRLYDAVADHDLVLVPDAPLADAINRRLDRPHLGTFAVTPRRLATGRREPAEDRTAFLDVIEDSDYSWKRTARTIGDVIQSWEYEARPGAILEYDRFDTPEVRDILESVRALDTTSKRLTEYAIDPGIDVAVVAEPQFTPLERSILPADYDRIDPFTDEAFEHPPFRVFESPTAIVDALVDAINAETADDVAVVLDAGSEYSTLLESALESAEIPFYGGPGFTDDTDVRALLRLLRIAFAGSDIRVADVRPVLNRLGADPSIEHDRKRVTALEDPAVEWIQTFVATADSKTFGEALSEYEAAVGTSLARFREELRELDVHDEPLTADIVDDVAFYLDSYEVPIDRDNEGVLLADATAAGFVDRPVVFFLGLDDGWVRGSPERPWVDSDDAYERNRDRFEFLLQSGTERHYLVQDTAGGNPVTPCLYFEDLLESDYERFSDLPSVRHRRPDQSMGDGFAHEPVAEDVGTTSHETLSQSSLNSYVNSPRDYFFDQVVDSPDRDYFREGNLFHDFAECYVEHGNRIDEATIDELAAEMVDELSPYVRPVEDETRRTRFEIGLRNIAEFIDFHPPEATDIDASTGWGTNFVADYLGLDIESPVTEQWFEDADLGTKGLIDYVQSPTHLVDYKTGSKKSRRAVVKNSAIEEPTDTPDYQALLYLTYQRRQRPGERLSFTFVHFLENLDDVITGDADPADLLTTVRYYPEPFADFVASGSAYDELCDGYSDCRGTFEALGYETYATVMGDLGFPDADRDEIRDSEYADALVAAVEAAVPPDIDADVEKGCDQAIRALAGLRERNYFESDLDAFEAFLDERLTELNDRLATGERFPVDGLGEEANERYLNHRDLLLNDD
ncbi:PD-(D/E)XK nuclease family protein [Natronomonas halophila]|uniref:PD-(D/E)XK nuclease family protein n=1 Tax=Natronomonas halophila TaxID=2747817 RepID=UPI0015B3B0DC|nr:PD-(D/E)XK nuclease family protein [Natronomonas halophila]QLD87153.1 PD-(D/E)XK nuclease family protein [Natronomonas halophila]